MCGLTGWAAGLLAGKLKIENQIKIKTTFDGLRFRTLKTIAAFGAFGGQVFFLSHSFFKKSLNKMNT